MTAFAGTWLTGCRDSEESIFRGASVLMCVSLRPGQARSDGMSELGAVPVSIRCDVSATSSNTGIGCLLTKIEGSCPINHCSDCVL